MDDLLESALLSQKPAHLRVSIGQLARGPIGIEKPRTRYLLQATGERRFAGGNAAGDSDDGADAGHQMKVASKGTESPSSTLSVTHLPGRLGGP